MSHEVDSGFWDIIPDLCLKMLTYRAALEDIDFAIFQVVQSQVLRRPRDERQTEKTFGALSISWRSSYYT